MRTKRMLRRGLTALAAALAMMTALAAPAFAYTGDSVDSTAETAAQQSSASQTAVQTERIGTVTTNGGRLNLRDGASTSYNIIFPSHKDYSLGFRDDQVEWLRQDLSYVSKDKMVIFCVHIPMRASNNQNVQAVLELLKPFAEVHIMSGHTHYAENNTYDSHYEHVHGAACGAWWHSTINTDGTPNGYAIYKVKGATIHWVDCKTAVDAEVRLYENLFSDAQPDGPDKNFLDCLNPNSLEVLTGCKVEAALVEEAKKYDAEGEGRMAHTAPGFQFMRVGYFCMDSRDCRADHLVFNRSVLLKDSFKPGK